MEPQPKAFSYVVDSQDCLKAIGPGWDHFADANHASGIGAKVILGRPLFSFLTDRQTRHIYGLLLEKARSTQREVAVPFRCDGPAVRRFLRLTLIPLERGAVRFETQILREEVREPVRLLERDVDRTGEFVSLCSWCKKIDIGSSWLEVEEGVEHFGLFDLERMPQISHACCPTCLGELERTAGS